MHADSSLRNPAKLLPMTSFAMHVARPSLLALALAAAWPAPAQTAPGSAVDYGVNATAARVQVSVSRNAVPADGHTPVQVTFKVLGANGQPLSQAVWATVESTGGRILLDGAKTDEAGPRGKDADRATPGVQLQVQNGQASFSLLAPMTAQDVQVRVTVGQHNASTVVSFVPQLRDMIAAGLVEGVIRFNGKSSTALNPARAGDGFEQALNQWSRQFNDGKTEAGARAALFLKGTIKGEYLLTAAYDSDKESRARALRDIQPEEFYPVYGDASLKGAEAKSDSRLYVRIDNNKSYLLYGDFATGEGFSQMRGGGNVAGLQQRSLGNMNRSATGVRYHVEEGQLLGNLFGFRDTLRQVVEEFSSQGSGPYGLRNNAVLESSEKIEMVVRDRNQPSRIVSVTPLVRLVDYTFEPFSGRILLSRFLPSADANLNPVSLRVSYEVDQGGDAFWVWGGDAQIRLGSQFEVGGSYLKDANPLAPGQLSSANVGWQIAPRTQAVLEVAHSSSTVNTNSVNASVQPGLKNRVGEVQGNAWRLELAHEQDDAQVRAFLGRSDAGFYNLAAPLAGGRGEASVRAAVKLSESLRLYTEALRSEDLNPGAADSTSAKLGLSAKIDERLTVDVALRALRQTEGTSSGVLPSPFASTAGLGSSLGSGSGGGAVGFGNQMLDPTTGLPVIAPGSSITGGIGSTLHASALHSNSVVLGLGFKASGKLSLGGEVERSISGDTRQRLALGGDYQVAELTRVYGRFERQTGLSGTDLITTPERMGNALVFGVDTRYLRDTQAFSEYRLRDALSGRDVQQAAGVRNTWDLAPGWRINTALEHTHVVSGAAPNTGAVSLGLDYTADPLWKGSTKLEYRNSGDVSGTTDNEQFSTRLWQIMGARKLDRDWTLLARNYLLQTDYAARGGVFQDRVQLGWPTATPIPTASMRWASWSSRTNGMPATRLWVISTAKPPSCPRTWTGIRAGPGGSPDEWPPSGRPTALPTASRTGLPPSCCRVVWFTTFRKTGTWVCLPRRNWVSTVHDKVHWGWRWATWCGRTCGCRRATTAPVSVPTRIWPGTTTPSAEPSSGCASNLMKTYSCTTTRA